MITDDIDFSKFKYCECNCGELIPVKTKHGDPARFKHGHSQRGTHNSMYKNGFYIDKKGYIHISKPEHPNRNTDNYVLQHRLIYEHYLSILMDEQVFIPNKYHIHHIIPVNEGGTNALINLELVTPTEHQRIHHVNHNISKRACYLCSSKYTSKQKNGKPIWYKYNKEFICVKCRWKFILKKKK